MGLILDSSVLIAAERRGDTVAKLLAQVIALTGDQQTAISAVSVVEIVHGIERANTPAVRTRREAFVQEILTDVPVHPLTSEIAILAGRLDGAQQRKGIKIPFADLLIGATALYAGCAVVTQDPRHFAMIPNLTVRQL